jgi:hypothetical protein
MSAKGNEAFYVENGVKKDAAIHDVILDGVSPEADLRHRTESFHRTVAKGIDPQVAARVYGLEGAFDLDPGPKSLR